VTKHYLVLPVARLPPGEPALLQTSQTDLSGGRRRHSREVSHVYLSEVTHLIS
jgi:hypothetical protein